MRKRANLSKFKNTDTWGQASKQLWVMLFWWLPNIYKLKRETFFFLEWNGTSANTSFRVDASVFCNNRMTE